MPSIETASPSRSRTGSSRVTNESSWSRRPVAIGCRSRIARNPWRVPKSVICSVARATGRRSASYESSTRGAASPRTASASFQPRLKASCTPVFMPCPPSGLWMCAASPASSTRPSR
ncbi:MAG TPA: hypothetical protein VFS43_43340 [Polyangiaceae bacterium]|nr:hypothetical protein [Polyangiaceae bacterium]